MIAIDRTGMNRETLFDLEIAEDVFDYHFNTEHDCTPDAPCAIVAYHQGRVQKIAGGAWSFGTAHADKIRLTDREVPRPGAGTRAANQYGVFQVIEASPAQVRYLTRLLGERDLTALPAIQEVGVRMAREQLAAGNLSKRVAMSALDYLTLLPVRADAPVRHASEKQIAFIVSLASERGVDLSADDLPSFSPEDASNTITLLLARPKAARPAVVVEVGMYRKADGTMFRAYRGRESGRILAKRLVAAESGWAFEYAGLAARFVDPSERMSLEEAKKWGAEFGTCCVCSAVLTDPSSIAAGIGPICASRV